MTSNKREINIQSLFICTLHSSRSLFTFIPVAAGRGANCLKKPESIVTANCDELLPSSGYDGLLHESTRHHSIESDEIDELNEDWCRIRGHHLDSHHINRHQVDSGRRGRVQVINYSQLSAINQPRRDLPRRDHLHHSLHSPKMTAMTRRTKFCFHDQIS